MLDYYFELKKPDSFRYFVMNGLKECILLQTDQEKLDLIRQAKKDLFKDIASNIKELESLSKKLELLLVDDDLKKEIQEEIQKERELVFQAEKRKAKQNLGGVSLKEKSGVEGVDFSKPLGEEVNSEPVFKEREKKQTSSDLSKFEYTLNNIEKKLAELKKD